MPRLKTQKRPNAVERIATQNMRSGRLGYGQERKRCLPASFLFTWKQKAEQAVILRFLGDINRLFDSKLAEETGEEE
jgi:hypothetical protein